MQLNNLPHTIYCERGLSSNFFAEPINAFTNLFFPLIGFLSFRLLKKKGIQNKNLLILPYLLFSVGLGSFIYHTARSSNTLILDAVPLYIFILFTLFLVLKNLVNSKIKSLLILGSFITLEVVLTAIVPREFLNGSIRHLTALLFISIIGFFIVKKYGSEVKKPLFLLIFLYAIAIVFRSIDAHICSVFPIGTHFLWHTFAAFASYQAIKLLIFTELNKSKVDSISTDSQSS